MRNIPFGRPMIGDEERQAILNVVAGPTLVHGPRCHDFETAFSHYVGGGHAVAVSSCTAAMHLTYFSLGIGRGDEVIVPAQTHVATAHAVELCGAKPVFVDAELATGNMDIAQIEARLSPRAKAIAIVHYLGMPVDMDQLMSIAKRHGLVVVEDCALALGTSYKNIHAGLYGDVGCFSFYPVKHITTAEGGMLLTKDADLARRITRQRAFGVDRTPTERGIPGVYDTTMLGFNYRMNEIQAAIGIEQLKKADNFITQRRDNFNSLSEGLRSINGLTQFSSSHGDYCSSYYCFSVLLDSNLAPKRYEIVEHLRAKGVGTSIYYPRPVPLMAYYRVKYGYRDGDFPIAQHISQCSIALPVGPHLDREDMAYIVEMMKQAIAEVKKQ